MRSRVLMIGAFLALSANFALVGVSHADTINVPGDQATIQDAIDAASSGDTINVAVGVYPENLTLIGQRHIGE